MGIGIINFMSQAALESFPFYFYLDILTILPLLFTAFMLTQYLMLDKHVRRQCLPIAGLFLIVITGLYIF